MNNKEITESIEKIEALLTALKYKAKINQPSIDSFHSIGQLSDIVNQYCKTHSITLNDFAILANIGRATLTRTMQEPNNSNIKSVQAILNVMGKNLYIGNPNNEN